jgi:hypothetical protein
MASRFRQNPEVEVAPLDRDVLLFHPGANRFCVLNPTAARMWARMELPATVDELAQDLSRAFEAPAELGAVVADVERTVIEMRNMALLLESTS